MKLHRILITLLLFVSISLQHLFPQETNNPIKVLEVNDAAWCWFSDPRAIYHKGTKEKAYFGFINRKGDVMARSYDLKTSESEEFILHKELQINDHNVPTFLILPDGKILAFYNHHNGNIFMRKSKKAESIADWDKEVILLKEDNLNRYSYTNPIMLSEENNRIYLFGRNIVRNKDGTYNDTRIFCIYSDDYGETWSKEVNILNNGGRDTRQYVKYTSDNKSRIDFLLTDGHPSRQSDISVYHMYYKDGVFRQTNNDKIIPFSESPVEINKINRVYDVRESNIRSWIWDIALDKKNRPIITYAKFPSSMEHQYYYAKWDGRKWNQLKIADAGNYITIIRPGESVKEKYYSGGVVIDHNNPENVYLSKKVNGKFEIEKCEIKKNKIHSVQSITTNSLVDNIRPFVIKNDGTHSPILMWMSGNYYHYTDYETDLNLMFVK